MTDQPPSQHPADDNDVPAALVPDELPTQVVPAVTESAAPAGAGAGVVSPDPSDPAEPRVPVAPQPTPVVAAAPPEAGAPPVPPGTVPPGHVAPGAVPPAPVPVAPGAVPPAPVPPVSSRPPLPPLPPAGPAPHEPYPGPGVSDSGGGLAALFPADQPERVVGAAFAGGLVLALILKRLAR